METAVLPIKLWAQPTGFIISRRKDKKRLLLYLVMSGMFFAPFAKLLECYFTLNFFLIFSAPVIDAFTLTAGKFYKLIL